jgi:hypothetical protein
MQQFWKGILQSEMLEDVLKEVMTRLQTIQQRSRTTASIIPEGNNFELKKIIIENLKIIQGEPIFQSISQICFFVRWSTQFNAFWSFISFQPIFKLFINFKTL